MSDIIYWNTESLAKALGLKEWEQIEFTKEEIEWAKKHCSSSFPGEKNPFFGKTHSEETKKKQSELKKGLYEGENNPFYGKSHTEEHKHTHSELMKKRLKNKENHPLYGKKHSEKTKELISKNHHDVNGKNNPMYGKKHSEETRRKIKERLAERRKNLNIS